MTDYLKCSMWPSPHTKYLSGPWERGIETVSVPLIERMYQLESTGQPRKAEISLSL